MADAEPEIHRHLSDALLALGRCLVDVGPTRQTELADVARLLTLAQQRLSHRPHWVVPFIPSVSDESDDERIERKAGEASERTGVMLDRLCLSDLERQFAQDVGERIVDLVTDEYQAAGRRGPRLDGAVITAAAAVALLIVHDPG